DIAAELAAHKALLDDLTAKVVEIGLATWAGGDSSGSLIVRGQANLLDDVTAVADLERIRNLFQTLETKETMGRLLSLADGAEGVGIFIGADNDLFGVAGCSLVVGPYHNAQNRVVGAIGVIGPTRMNYARIIPMVDYTAKLVGRLIG
ncbi:MAG: heat-inducible transcriptional repressor HrcA, partial [Rhodobacterales bacterium]|nr:heat-inducible transcriptional repressor HrcA [Rhodobacterales bacterium]